MIKQSDLLNRAATLAPGLFRGKTWLAIASGLLILFALIIWLAFSLLSWLWSQTQNAASAAPEILSGPARSIVAQVNEVIPGARAIFDEATGSLPAVRDAIGGLTTARNTGSPLLRDVSGNDIGPVSRFPGLLRSQWLRTETQIAVEYEGPAEIARVIDHYAQGFSSQGFKQTILSATARLESHEFSNQGERFNVRIEQTGKDQVRVRLETAQP
jgi:hypothetical protein